MNHKIAVIVAILQLVSWRFVIRYKSWQEVCRWEIYRIY